MRNVIKSFLADIRELNFSSKKRLIKFIGCCLIPILYAIVCMVAFWDPMARIDHSKVGFLDNDAPTGLVQYVTYDQDENFDNTGFKIAADSNYVILNNEDFNKTYNKNGLNNDDKEQTVYFSDNTSMKFTKVTDNKNLEKKIFDTDGISKYSPNVRNIYKNGADNKYYVFIALNYETLAQLFINGSHVMTVQKQGKTMEDSTYGLSVNTSSGILNFNNIKYVDNKKANKEYKSNRYNIQVYFDKGLTENAITELNKALNGITKNDPTEAISDAIKLLSSINKLKVYTSYSQNFLFGTFMYTIRNFKFSFLANLVAHIFNTDMPIPNLINNKAKKDLHIDLKQITELISEGSINNVIETSKKITNYGIGLGQLFILIALSAGSIAITFVLDRSKRVRRASHLQWFFGKYLNMLFMGSIQVTALTFVAIAVGYHKVGLLSCFELWLWWLFIDAAILFVFSCLWYTFRSEAMGRLLMIIYLLINIALGWGSFPTFMMAKVFDIISLFTLYRYSSKTTSSIIYGQHTYGLTLFENIGSILLICLLFFILAFFTTRMRCRDIHFGSYKGKYVILGLEDAKIDTNQFYMTRIERRLYVLNSKRAKILNNTHDKILISELNAELNFIKSLSEEVRAKKENKIKRLKHKLDILNDRTEMPMQAVISKAAKEKRIKILNSKLEKLTNHINELLKQNVNDDDKLLLSLKNKKDKLSIKIKSISQGSLHGRAELLSTLITKTEAKIKNGDISKFNNKMVYNWQYLNDLTRVDYVGLNKKTNKHNRVYKGFEWYKDGEDYKPELPALSDDVLTSRND